jgi:hypothetical protein
LLSLFFFFCICLKMFELELYGGVFGRKIRKKLAKGLNFTYIKKYIHTQHIRLHTSMFLEHD